MPTRDSLYRDEIGGVGKSMQITVNAKKTPLLYATIPREKKTRLICELRRDEIGNL
jgi:hypothetical protein